MDNGVVFPLWASAPSGNSQARIKNVGRIPLRSMVSFPLQNLLPSRSGILTPWKFGSLVFPSVWGVLSFLGVSLPARFLLILWHRRCPNFVSHRMSKRTRLSCRSGSLDAASEQYQIGAKICVTGAECRG